MARFLLIHGSCHGAWCWDRVIPEIAALGHEARAIDLPGRAGDPTPGADITLDQHARAILTAVAAMGGDVLLVGHSMAGYPITAAAETDPSGIAGLVYLCAYAPASGLSLAQMRRAGPHQPLAGAFVISEGGARFSFDPAQAEELLYLDCPPGTTELALRQLVPEPVAPQETPLTITARSQTLPRHYIRCLDDRTIPPEYQETMAAAWPGMQISSLPSSHSPFFSMPGALAQRLTEIAAA